MLYNYQQRFQFVSFMFPRRPTEKHLHTFSVCRQKFLFRLYPCAVLITFFIFFSALIRGTITSLPQPVHFSLKSIPERRTVKVFAPHGCCFFISSMSPILTSILSSRSKYILFYFIILFTKVKYLFSTITQF